jgi:outer membrane protein TolC
MLAPLLAGLALAGSIPAAPAAGAPATAPQAITFDEAVARARTRAVTSLVAFQEIRRADGLLVQARSGSLPALGVGGSYTRLDQSRVTGPREQLSGNVQASLALSAARWYQWSHADDQLDAARAGLADVQRSAALTAGRAYLSVVAQRRVIEVSRRAVDTARAHFDFARSRREAGVGNLLDEVRAEQQLATSVAQLEAALTGLARLQEALGQATGDDVPLDAVAEPALVAPTVQDDLDAATRRRADVRAAGARAQAAARVARDSWADWLPTLLGTYSAYRQDWQTAFTPDHGWQAQVILSFPLFEGGLRAGQVRERNALDAEGAALLDVLLRQARSEVRSGWASLQHAEAAYAESKRAADRAGQALSMVTEAYKTGTVNSLDVIDAEQRARDGDTAAAVAEDAVRQARLDLLAATGRFP